MSVHIKKRTRVIKGGRKRASRQKTFKTEDSAKKYAEANNMADYSLVNLKSEASNAKKIRIVTK